MCITLFVTKVKPVTRQRIPWQPVASVSSQGIPYRGKKSWGKVTKFFASD